MVLEGLLFLSLESATTPSSASWIQSTLFP